MLGHLLHLDRVAQVRLVGAVVAHRLAIGNARELLRHRLAVGESFEHAADHRLHRREDVVLRDEAHLDVELVEFAGQPVGARILVAEAGRDLEIAVEARHHDELLELLRRLRQRVELSRMQPRRHQEVARALRRGGGQDRRLELVEAGRAHQLAHLRHDRHAAHDVLVQQLAAQIEEAVFEPRVLRIVGLAEDRQRQLRRFRQHLDLPRENLDLAGRQVRVDGLGRAVAHGAVDADAPFGAHALGRREGRRIRVGDDLREAVMVAQVDEEQPAMVAHAVHPARQADRRRRHPRRAALRRCGFDSDAWPAAILTRGSGKSAGQAQKGRKRVKVGRDGGPVPRRARFFEATDFPRIRYRARMGFDASEHTIITDTATLAAFCEKLSSASFITVDTEFMRESTFWAQLCLIQMAGPHEAAIIDPLVPGIDLAPFYALMADERGHQGLPRRAAGHRDLRQAGRRRPAPDLRHAGRRHGLRLWRPGELRPARLPHHRRGRSTRPPASPTGRAGRSRPSRSPTPSPTSRISATSTCR